MPLLKRLYLALLRHPLAAVLTLLLVVAVAAWFGRALSFDASSETLVVEGDPEFQEYLEVAAVFPSDDYLFITVEPDTALFSTETLDLIGAIETDLADLDGVTGTLSLRSVPLLGGEAITTLADDPGLLAEAKAYFASSMLFTRQLVAESGDAAAIQVTLKSLGEEHSQADRRFLIEQIREVRARYVDDARLHIAGVPLIAHDMMVYLRADVMNFGIAAALVICLALFLFFRRLRWLALCASNATLSVILVIGILGALDTPISVVSGNFISLLAIISISLTIHLVVRFRELIRTSPDQPHAERVAETMLSKFAPCAYTAVTTIVAFTSLLTSGIPPVEDFGWMMAVGVLCAFVVTYVFFPTVLLMLGPRPPSKTVFKPMRLSIGLGNLAVNRVGWVAGGALIVLMATGVGLARLNLDSQFSQYFKADSDIRQGLEYVDANFGGVLPLDVIVQLEPFVQEALDEDDDFFVEEEANYPQSAWFTSDKVRDIEKLTHYLRGRDDVGSATSLADLARLAEVTNRGQPLDDVQLALLVTLLDEGRASLVAPYANPDTGELRISVRMREATATADYPQVVADIERFATEELGWQVDRVGTTGMFILFGQSIRQLYESQRDTLIYVVVATLLMFVVLLRSLTFGIVGLAVNVLAAACVLAFMGSVGIPMDMMTITIAAITIGIGVDDAFHYLHRYREERNKGRNAHEAIAAVHRSIGRAIYFTSVTVVAGFSLLVLSNFVPTVYFGLLTALAMIIALVANLLLLPSLLLAVERFKPG